MTMAFQCVVVQYHHGGGLSWVCTVARPGFVPEKSSRPDFWSSLRWKVPSTGFFQGNLTTARPSQFIQLSGYWSFCFRNEGNALRSLESVGNFRATCPDCTPVSVPMPSLFAMSSLNVLQSTFAQMNPRRGRRRLPFVYENH